MYPINAKYKMKSCLTQARTLAFSTTKAEPLLNEYAIIDYRERGHANYFMDYDNFQSGPYGYSGYYNPYSLWGK